MSNFGLIRRDYASGNKIRLGITSYAIIFIASLFIFCYIFLRMSGFGPSLLPTDTGTVVNDFLTEYFPDILDYNFTATVEKQFDEIAEGEKQWTSVLRTFYDKFHPSVENTLATKNAHKAGERILGTDPASQRQVSVKIGRFGPMVQIGIAGDSEKPRFAQLKKGMSIETITLE